MAILSTVLRLALHPLHSARAALAYVADRPLPRTARRTWRRLWFDEHPLSDVSALDARHDAGGSAVVDPRRPVRLAGRERDAIVLDPPASRVWRTRSQPHGEVDLWCAIMPGDWRAGANARVTLQVSGETEAAVAVDLSPGASWAHRRWTRLRAPISGSADVTVDIRADGQPVQVAIADAVVRWRRPAAEVRSLARAFALRVRRGGLRDTARWAQQSARQQDDRERYRHWCARHTPDARALASMARGLSSWPDRVRFSILTPVWNTEPAWLEACIESVRAQVYPDWELILSDDGSTREETRAVLRAFETDPRVRIVWNGENRGIAAATQSALDRASGDFIALLDHDDALLPHALYRVAARLKTRPDADVLYSDEDKLELDGRRSDVYFKPDWSPDLFLSSMYVCHFLVMRRGLVADAGGFRRGYDGSQDYDLVLRVIERTPRIEHIPDVLYHWRKIPQSASSTGTAKPWAHLAGQRALQDYADRNALDAVVEDGEAPGLHRMRYRLRGEPTMSVVVCTKPPSNETGRGSRQDGREKQSRFLFGKRHPISSYPNLEVVLVVPPGAQPATDNRGRASVRVIEASGGEADRLNAGARAATGEYLLFMSASVEPRHDDWIEALLEHAQRPEVGAVGAKLFHPDGRLHHMGLVVGPGGVGRRSFDGYAGTWAGYFSNANAIRNCAAVSRAAVMLSRRAFDLAGGWRDGAPDPDVDLGRRLWEAGLRVVFTPYARFTEHEAGVPPELAEPRRHGFVEADLPPSREASADRRSGSRREPPNDAALSGREATRRGGGGQTRLRGGEAAEPDRDPYYNLHFAADSADYVIGED